MINVQKPVNCLQPKPKTHLSFTFAQCIIFRRGNSTTRYAD